MTIISLLVIIALFAVITTMLGLVAVEERDDARNRLMETRSALYDEKRAHSEVSLALHRKMTREPSVSRDAVAEVPPRAAAS